jgi:hypothetical protein
MNTKPKDFLEIVLELSADHGVGVFDVLEAMAMVQEGATEDELKKHYVGLLFKRKAAT